MSFNEAPQVSEPTEIPVGVPALPAVGVRER